MPRFVAIDLAKLPPPDAVQVPDFEALLAERKADIVARVAARVDDPALIADLQAVLNLESEPLTIDAEVGTYREVIMHERINDAVRAVLLPTSRGADLDALCSRLGVQRMTITPATQTAAAVMESDSELQYRYQLALEAFSVAGPYGAYEFHARSTHPGVKDAACYGPESGLVTPGQTLTVLLSRTGNGAASAEIVNAVTAKLGNEDVVPDTDQVFVRSATITNYAISYHLQVRPGADPAVLVNAAIAALTAYAAECHKVGHIVALSALDGAAHQDRVNVVRAVRASPVAEVNPGLDGAPYCTGITVTYEVTSG